MPDPLDIVGKISFALDEGSVGDVRNQLSDIADEISGEFGGTISDMSKKASEGVKEWKADVDKVTHEYRKLERAIRRGDITTEEAIKGYEELSKQADLLHEQEEAIGVAHDVLTAKRIDNLDMIQKSSDKSLENLKKEHSLLGKIDKVMAGFGVKTKFAELTDAKKAMAAAAGFLQEKVKELFIEQGKYITQNFVMYGSITDINEQILEAGAGFGVLSKTARESAEQLMAQSINLGRLETSLGDLAGEVGNFVDMTGVSAASAAKLTKQFEAQGLSMGHLRSMFETVKGAMAGFAVTGEEAGQIIDRLAKSAMMLTARMGETRFAEYSEKLSVVMGLTKGVGGDLQAVSQVFQTLETDATKFAVALGAEGLYAPLEDQIGIIIERSDELMQMVKGTPEFMQEQMAQAMLNMSMGTVRAFQLIRKEAAKEFGKTVDEITPAMIKSYAEQKRIHTDAIRNFTELTESFVNNIKVLLVPLVKGINYISELLVSGMRAVEKWTEGWDDWAKITGTVIASITSIALAIATLIGGLKLFSKTASAVVSDIAEAFIDNLSYAIFRAMKAIGAGLTAMSRGLRALANPKVVVGLVLLTASAIGLGFALKLAAPFVEAFGKALTDVLKEITIEKAAAVGVLGVSFAAFGGALALGAVGMFAGAAAMAALAGPMERVVDAAFKVRSIGPRFHQSFENIAKGVEAIAESSWLRFSAGAASIAFGLRMITSAVSSNIASASLIPDVADALSNMSRSISMFSDVEDIRKVGPALDSALVSMDKSLEKYSDSIVENITNVSDSLAAMIDNLERMQKSAEEVRAKTVLPGGVNAPPAAGGGTDASSTIVEKLDELIAVAVGMNIDGKNMEEVRAALIEYLPIIAENESAASGGISRFASHWGMSP